jgi:hypothetical protein
VTARISEFLRQQSWRVEQLATDAPDNPGAELPAIVTRHSGGTFRPEVCRTRATYGAAEYENAAARLIASAPDLLAALETLTDAVSEIRAAGISFASLNNADDAGRAAIARAKGDA